MVIVLQSFMSFKSSI